LQDCRLLTKSNTIEQIDCGGKYSNANSQHLLKWR